MHVAFLTLYSKYGVSIELFFCQCILIMLSTRFIQGSEMTWDRYYSLEEIENWMESLAEQYNFISTIDVGQTYEGRSIKALRISWGTRKNASAIIIGGIHANEHIGPAATTLLINTIVESKINRTGDDYADVNYYFIPVANPDGYKYSFETDRSWRKNREPIVVKNETVYGVDLNRNWITGWKRHKRPWQPNYSGKEPFSALETRALSRFIKYNITNLNTFVTIHNYGQYIIYPWTHVTAPIRDYKHVKKVAENMAKAIKAQGGPMYNVGSGASKLAIVPGTPENWARRRAEIKYVYSVVLRDQGNYGYEVPTDLITTVAGDAVAAITCLVKNMKHFRRIQAASKPYNPKQKTLFYTY